MQILKNGRISLGFGEVDSYITNTGCYILLGKEGDSKVKRWHLSISHKDRYPTWDEIKEARERLLSRNKDFAMIFPKPEDYVNIQENCFHLWEIKKGELIQAIDRF